MGLIGKYLALLDEVERDRVIEAQAWVADTYGEPGAPRCLVGHAECGADSRLSRKAEAVFVATSRNHSAEESFDCAVARFGMDRVVRAVKLRAATPDRAERIRRIPLPQQHVGAGR